MSDAQIFIARGICSSCPPTPLEKGKKVQVLKWGLVVEIGQSKVMICRDCLDNIIKQTHKAERMEMLKHGQRVVSKKKNI